MPTTGSRLTFGLVMVYLGLVYVRPQEYVAALSEVPILPAFLIASTLAWVFQRGKSFEASQHWQVLLIVGVAAFSVAVNGWLGGATKAFLDLWPILVLYYLLSTTTNTPGRHVWLMRAVAAFTVLMALHGVLQSASPTGEGWSGAKLSEGTRITYIGIFNDPNDLALAFVIALPMLAFLWSDTRATLAKALWGASALTVIYALYLTNSRGGILAALAQLGVFLLRRWGVWKTFVAGAVLAVPLLMLPSRLGEINAEEASAAGRVDSWYAGIQMLLANPLFGVGRGNYVLHHELTAHNSMVLAFAETGMVGYYFWLGMVVLSGLMVYRISQATSDGAYALPVDSIEGSRLIRVARTYLYSLIGFAVAGFFLSRTFNILLFVLCALCVGIYQCVRREYPAFGPINFRSIAGIVALLAILSVMFMYGLVKILL